MADFDHKDALSAPDPTAEPLQGEAYKAAQEADKQTVREALTQLADEVHRVHDALLGSLAGRGVRGELALMNMRLQQQVAAL